MASRFSRTSLLCALVCVESQCDWGGVHVDRQFYDDNRRKFVGLNPRDGYGSGFFKTQAQYANNTDFGNAPETNGVPPASTRVDLCTCDCNASDAGVGCVGYGGIKFRYMSLLSAPSASCTETAWWGQMVALECPQGGGMCNETDPAFKGFIGDDWREYPGGPAIYRVTALTQTTNKAFAGVFRQPNGRVSCQAGLIDADSNSDVSSPNGTSCFSKCGGQGQYNDWIDYCKLTEENTGLGFTGWSW